MYHQSGVGLCDNFYNITLKLSEVKNGGLKVWCYTSGVILSLKVRITLLVNKEHWEEHRDV